VYRAVRQKEAVNRETYLGDGNYRSFRAKVTEVVGKPTPVLTLSTTPAKARSGPVTYRATVSGRRTTVIPSGTVIVRDGKAVPAPSR
jgi:hypothetical protein